MKNQEKVIKLAELRPDVVKPSTPRKEILKKAQKTDGEYFIVPLVVE